MHLWGFFFGLNFRRTLPRARTKGARLWLLPPSCNFFDHAASRSNANSGCTASTRSTSPAACARSLTPGWQSASSTSPKSISSGKFTGRAAQEVEALDPPRSLAGVHRDVQNAVISAARACQLLANGYRFHKSEAVCDGQALLVDTVQEFGELVAQLQMRF